MYDTPITPAALAGLPIPQARAAYAAAGLAPLPTYAHAYRRRTPAEDGALEDALRAAPADADLLEQRRTGWTPDTTDAGRQLRVDTTAGIVALRVPRAVFEGNADACASGVWQGLAPAVAAAPAIISHDGASVMVLFKDIPGQPTPEHRVLALITTEPGFERVAPVPAGDLEGGVRLPCAGHHERWARLCAPPTLPTELGPLTLDSAAVSADLIREWLDTHFEKIGMLSSAKPTDRATVYRQWLAANKLTESQYSEKAFGDACHDAKCFASKRTKNGIVWQITRRADVPALGAMAGVAAEDAGLSAIDVAEFRQWKHSIELSPARRAARAEQAAAAQQRAEQEAHLARVWGNREVLEQLQQSDYIKYHRQAEARRWKASGTYGEAFTELAIGDVSEYAAGTPRVVLGAAAWQISPPGTPPAERYRALVKHYIEGAVQS